MESFVRVRHPDGRELTIDLIQLEDAMQQTPPGDYYLLPNSGRILHVWPADLDVEDEEDENSEEPKTPGDEEAVPIDEIESRDEFRWMEEFIDTVRSISAQNALRDALRHKKPFRNFKEALMGYPVVREMWFQFEALQVRKAAVSLLEGIDFEILEIVDPRPVKIVSEGFDPAANLPVTDEERECILCGAWLVAAKGGRSQLALLLKGSKSKPVLKYGLDRSPMHGKLSHLTIEEIENRIDQLIRKGELRTQFFGDLPLILLTEESWLRIKPWAQQYECEQAGSASPRELDSILNNWRNRRRDEQQQLLEAMTRINPESAKRVLQEWHSLSGKEMRSRIEAILSTLA